MRPSLFVPRLLPLILICLYFAAPATVAAAEPTYGQRQALSRQSRNLTEYEKALAPFSKMRGFESKVFKINQLDGWLNGLRGFTRKLDGVLADLNKNGVDLTSGQGAALRGRVDAARTIVAVASAKIEASKKRSQMSADVSSYATYQPDSGRLKALAEVYLFADFRNQPNRLVELARSLPDDSSWAKRKRTEYRLLIAQAKSEGNQIRSLLDAADRAFDKFKTRGQAYIKAGYDKVPASVASANTMIKGARAAKNPMKLRGARQALDEAWDYLQPLVMLNGKSKDVVELKTAYDASVAEAVKTENELAEELAASEKAPLSAYGGGDKGRLRKLVQTAWKAKYPADQILAIRFHQAKWTRTVSVKVNQTHFYKQDTSVLALSVIVKKTAKLATIYPAFVNKDNHKGGLNAGVATKRGGYRARDMLIANL